MLIAKTITQISMPFGTDPAWQTFHEWTEVSYVPPTSKIIKVRGKGGTTREKEKVEGGYFVISIKDRARLHLYDGMLDDMIRLRDIAASQAEQE